MLLPNILIQDIIGLPLSLSNLLRLTAEEEWPTAFVTKQTQSMRDNQSLLKLQKQDKKWDEVTFCRYYK